MRYALDYDGIMALAGPGAVRLAGVVPTGLPEALDPREAVRTDRPRAMALLKEAGLPGVKGTLTYASDLSSWGVPMGLIAQKIQADLAAVGMAIGLNGLPHTVVQKTYSDGRIPLGMRWWVADYPDSSNFLVFAPGNLVGRRVGWLADSGPEASELAQLAQDAERDGDLTRRAALVRRIQRRLAEIGPYAPLFQPATAYAFRSNVQGVAFHTVWGFDLGTVSK